MSRTLPSFAALLLLARCLAPAPSSAADTPPLQGAFENVGEVPGGVPTESTPFDAGGERFFTLAGGGARVWDTATLKPIAGPFAHDHIWYARLVAGGRTLFTGGPKDVKVWDVRYMYLSAKCQLPEVSRIERRWQVSALGGHSVKRQVGGS